VPHTLEELTESLSTANAITKVLLTTARGMVIVTDQSLSVVHLSQRAATFFEVLPHENLKATLIEIVRDHRINSLAESVLSNKNPTYTELEYVHGARILSVECLPITPNANEIYGIAIAIEDLTELKRLETVRQEFLNNVSHEIRTPLASIKAMAETLASDSISHPSERHDFLNRITNEVDHLTALIEEFRMLSNVESGNLPITTRKVTLKNLVASTINRLQAHADAKNLQIIYEEDREDLYVEIDPIRFQQILANLVENAIKFTEPTGSITITTAVIGKTANVSVIDTGIGIASEHVDRIFERLYKVDSSRNSSGSGLGLAIAKHLVQTQGGHISVASSLHQGSAFQFSLPIL
jgi:two-component system phosphate regulon sensor histidine kinase PhoR